LIDGLAVVDKPPRMTSHDVVGRCRRIFGQRRVGHGGTLDPDATGVLVVGLGRCTRLLRYLSGLSKTYEALIRLGESTTTLDAAGDVTGRWDMADVTLEAARSAASGLTGSILQTPPMVSAVKVGGKRLHQLARMGVEVERTPREVEVSRFDLSLAERDGSIDDGSIDDGSGLGPVLRARIECSSGTYVRVLAADLGEALGGGAHVLTLCRTSVGPWGLDSAVALDALGLSDVLAPYDALPWMQAVEVDSVLEAEVRHGRVLDLDRLAVRGNGPWRVATVDGDLLAVYEPHGEARAKPAVVVAAEESGEQPARPAAAADFAAGVRPAAADHGDDLPGRS
jgi:tRNA pseudouridine55 synthase